MEQIMSIICTVGAFLLLLLIGYLRMRGNVKEWLLWAVTQAEQYLGSGTGALKLRYVYDLAVEAFPPIEYLVPFSVFPFGWMRHWCRCASKSKIIRTSKIL